MHLKRLITASLAALALPLSASAGSLVIPAAGTGPGANSSHWKSELTIANLSADPVDVSLVFHDRNGAGTASAVTIPAHATIAEDDVVASRFGEAVAKRVGPIWGFDVKTQELRNMWTRTRQPGLWFTGGAFSQCRIYSRYIALQIDAIEAGKLAK